MSFNFKLISRSLSLLIILTSVGCGGGGGGGGNSTPTNSAPIANAGAAQAGVVGGIVQLDGRTSTDADSDPLTYQWSLVSRPTGSATVLTGATTAQPTLSPDIVGQYSVSLVVSDGKINSAVSTILVTAQPLRFSLLPPANLPVERSVPDWIISSTTSSLTGAVTTTMNASSLEGDFIITCTSDGSFNYYFKTALVTANGAINYRIGPTTVVSASWSESSANGFRVLTPPSIDIELLKKFYRNWDFVLEYNAFGNGKRQAQIGVSGFSNAIDKTRSNCKWSTELFPPKNGWGKDLPLVPPDDAKEASDVSGMDVSKSYRLIAWRALNSAGKPQLLVRIGDPKNNNNIFLLDDKRFLVLQGNKVVSAVSGINFQSRASDPTILVLSGDFDASQPFRLVATDFVLSTLDPLKTISFVDFN